ncbi:Glycogen synthase [Planctomycetes bacterium Pan216]|uniref:Glycogen synthase n=1 Tax=Kolteria novifilia TaxID=2527975 RepID=A0A518BCB3_9BACT|nr:Glycogen synthase [Planctomycetes bacterium Pan216]
MDIVFVASEAVPYAKTGGLADVVGALPASLAKLGHQVTIILPCFRSCRPFIRFPSFQPTVDVNVGERRVEGVIKQAESTHEGVRVLLVDQPSYFDRAGLYVDEHGQDYSDNCERFTFFCRAAFAAMEAFDLNVDCVHAHDWHTGLLPVILQHEVRHVERFARTGSIFTIHNIAFQGLFDRRQWYITRLDDSLLTSDRLEYFGRFSFMKGGIVFSDVISTVSRRYAQEIQELEFGGGLDPLLRHRADRLTGIPNGIDFASWDPANDPHVPVGFDRETWKVGKRESRRVLREELGLEQREETPLLGIVSRLTDQKGIDLLASTIRELLSQDLQLVILGTGDHHYESLFGRLSQQFSRQLSARLRFDEGLARRIYAGADMLLMPSLFEPCGLSQLYSLRYGTVPIVRAVGGLYDTVVDATPATIRDRTATGFHFDHYTPEAFLSAIRRATGVFRNQATWARLVEQGMSQDWSWQKSAKQYVELYRRATFLAGARSR